MVKRRHISAVILGLVLAAPLAAQPPTTAVIGTPPQPGWSLLSAQQKATLAPLARDWDDLDNIRRKKWLGIAERYPAMKPDEQRRMQERMREWANLTPEQRAKVRDTYKEFNQLPSEQKQTVKQKWEAFSSLPPEEQQRLRHEGKSSSLLAPPPGAELAPTPQEQFAADAENTATTQQPVEPGKN
ncbi:MAG: DUF3106 domain-containing protein [Candidatus Dechloromonas phosphoritropha]